VLKQAEDNDDLILRCYEVAGSAVRATISLPIWNRTLTIDMGPSEIKTIRIPIDPTAVAYEVNLIEWSEDAPKQ
jgi:alpha-mannosidase